MVGNGDDWGRGDWWGEWGNGGEWGGMETIVLEQQFLKVYTHTHTQEAKSYSSVSG